MFVNTSSISSIGRAAALLQAMPNRIRAAADKLGIKPAVRINDIEHFDDADLQRIREHLAAKGKASK